MCSRNVSVQNSPGYTRKDDPAYTSLPADSRKPPGPVDPSSAYISRSTLKVLSNFTRFLRHPVSKWFYIASAQV